MTTTMHGPWRSPAVESDKLYPGLSVCDNRVSGSILIANSRLPLWTFVHTAVTGGWAEVEGGWSPEEHYGYTARDLADFLSNLLEMRGEFGRLLLVLADAERSERRRKATRTPWWKTKKHRKRVGDQLRRCLAVLEDKSNDERKEP